MRKFRVLGILLVFVLLLSACRRDGGRVDAPLSTGPTTFGLTPKPAWETLRLGFFVGTPLSIPFYIAYREGFFRELNINVEFSTFTNGPAMVEANAVWDMASLGPGGTLVGMMGHDLNVIAIADYERHISLFARPGSALALDKDNPNVWRGTHWVYPMGTTAQLVLAANLSRLGLSLMDVNSTSMDVVSALTAFHVGGHGDGLSVWAVQAFTAKEWGYVLLESPASLDLTIPAATLAHPHFIRDRLDLAAYAYIVFYKTWEWANRSPENFERAIRYFYESSAEEGMIIDWNIARQVMEFFNAPFFAESVDIMTSLGPDPRGLYTSRLLSQAERDILVPFDFFIAEHMYRPEDRVRMLDRRLVDDRVALRAREILQEQGIAF